MSLQLTVEGVAARYGPRLVFREVSLALGEGEVLVVSGPNGSGKSTFLRLLAGLQRPDAGIITYEINGIAYTPREAAPLLGWVAPDLMLYRDLTARENLRFFAAVRGLPRDDRALDRLLARVGLEGRGDDRLATYSSGMLQRLRYAYALLHRPPVLLLDEPTITLDEHGAKVVDELIDAQRRGGLAIIATNDPRELRYADLVLQLGG